MKKLLSAQTSNGMEQEFDYGIKNNTSQQVTNPLNVVTKGADGTYGHALGTDFEKTASKQNSMEVDGTGAKYPTVDAVNSQANAIARATLQTGLVTANDAFNVSRFDDNNLQITGTSVGVVFSSYLNTPPFAPSDAIKQIPTQKINLSVFLPDVPAGTQTVKYLGWRHTTQSLELSENNYLQNPNVFQMGIIYLKNVGGVISFIDANRSVIAIPDISSYSNLETTSTGLKGSISISPNANMTIKNTEGTIVGVSVNYKGSNNDEKAIPAQNPTVFSRLNPSTANGVTLPAETSTVQVNDYWNGTAMTLLSANGNASVQRFLLTVRGFVVLQVGEAQYNNLDAAKSAIYTAPFHELLPKGTYVEVSRLAAVKSTTNLQSVADAQFVNTSSGGGGGTGTTTVAFADIQGQPQDNTNLNNALNLKANLASPSLTGVPTAPTATAGTNTTQLATTAFVTTATHNPVTIGTANGLSLSTQQLSLGLASAGVTGALSVVDWNIFNGKFPTPTGLTTNYLPKWNGTGFGDSSWQEIGGRLTNGSDNLVDALQVDGSGSFNAGVKSFATSGNRPFIFGSSTAGQNYGLFLQNNGTSLAYMGDANGSAIGGGAVSDFAVIAPNGKLFLNGDSGGVVMPYLSGTGTRTVVADASGNLSATATPPARPYLVYTALLSQTGTNAPTATVLENTLGGTVSFTRTVIGQYIATSSNSVFTSGKTACIITNGDAFGSIGSQRDTSSNVTINSISEAGAFSDNVIYNATIEIRVYL